MCPLVIVASRLLTSVGYTAPTACAAMRCQIARFEESHYLDDDLQPIVVSQIPGLGRTRNIRERLLLMLDIVLKSVSQHPILTHASRVPLFMPFVEQPRPGADDELARELLAHACSRLGSRFDMRLASIDYGGAPAGFRALQRAADLITSGAAELCIVVAVDSWIDARSLLWLGERSPIHTARSGDGVIPGEAGALLLLANAQLVSSAEIEATILGFASSVEPAVSNPDVPTRGDGLTKAISKALRNAGLEFHDLRLRLSDAHGDHNTAKEQMLALARLLRVRMEDLPLWLSAECIGHVGAAAGLVQIAWAIHSAARGYLPGSPALCTVSNFAGERAAAIVEVPTRNRGRRWS
jgi:3-oxoacyl-[acyl-carrier-protein] synthase-1